jgi:ribosome maturation factor RimP
VRETAGLDRLAEVVEGVLPEGTELVEARFSGGPLLTVLLDREDAPVDHGEPLDGRRNFTGVIDRTGEDAFVLRLSEGAEVELPFGSVTRANLKEDIYK